MKKFIIVLCSWSLVVGVSIFDQSIREKIYDTLVLDTYEEGSQVYGCEEKVEITRLPICDLDCWNA